MASRCRLLFGDCLERMKDLESNSIDLCLTDPPYGTSVCKWDSVIPFEPMWKQVKRIVKFNGAICLFGGEPFLSHLRSSNLEMFKYDWIWKKSRAGNFAQCKRRPLNKTEIISVFYRKQPTYNPIMFKGEKNHATKNFESYSETATRKFKGRANTSDLKYPVNVIEIKSTNSVKNVHPTQKPTALLEYLIRTYTEENETVLDFTMGSGSTGVAALSLKRRFIGIENNKKYFRIAKQRIRGE